MAKKQPKPPTNPTGRVSVDLFDEKTRLDEFAKASLTTGTNLARILIRDGLDRMMSGKFRVTMPALVSVEGEDK